MKIEIGESLALSYLKHVKKCIIYQNNWKISSQWVKTENDMAEDIFHKIKHIEEYVKKKELENEIENRVIELFKNIFPNKKLKEKIALYQKLKQTEIDSTQKTLQQAKIDDICKMLKQTEIDALNQILKQAEIDVLGIDQNGKIYTMDIAFHEGGLNYRSNKEETARRIIEKLLSSYMMLLRYFPDRDYEIIFASPKVREATESVIIQSFNDLNTFFDNNVELQNKVKLKNNVEFKYISNEEFRKEILDKTIKASEKDSDTNELFMRSYKLLELFDRVSNIAKEEIDLDKEIPPTASLVPDFEPANKKPSVLEFKPSEEKSLEFEFIPSDEKQFKKELIKTKQAKITWFYPDRQEETVWNADKISENSKIRENIRNRKKVKAREKSGLYKVKLEII